VIAGFFARMVVERRGVEAFAKDRAKRILLPLVVGLPIVMVLIGVGVLLGGLPHGSAYLMSLTAPPPGAAGAPAAAPAGGIDLAHLWFLYYLAMFYVVVLGVRAAVHAVDSRRALAAICDRVVAFLMRGPWGPVLLAVPAALYFWQRQPWPEWLGLPAPSSLVPQLAGFVGYGVPFVLGWLLHRQTPALMNLRKTWLLYFVLAIALTVVCVSIVGATPRWQGPNLHGQERVIYTAAYMVGTWCWVFALIGGAVRFLSDPHPAVRYLADASYWIYLMHMMPIVFFITLLRPYHLHWALQLAIMIGGSMPLLLVSYHYLVRPTWIGAILNGKRYPRNKGMAKAERLSSHA